ncbi:BTAD domain-containing putative transcriptional regulator [Streptomyces sp. NPDC048603]|uniref:AfsR/SARP family transcriptional regulator n=1 Tax=Streptomyces sp. NPDC048603 TaxID=3365577 RepID=UPI00371C0BF8
MDIEALGGLRVRENGVLLVPAEPHARQVLAVLAAHADQLVPASVLAGELAVHTPAERTRAVLHACVRQLRDLLAGAADPRGRRTPEAVLVSRPGGYLLDTGGGRSDLDEFTRDAGAGYRAMARGDFETAARRLRGALALWRGPAFDGVVAGPRIAERIDGLERTRRSVLTQWVEARLALGRHRELRTELRTGGIRRALEAHRQLADALGVGPGAGTGVGSGSGPGGEDSAREVRRALLRGAAV